MWVQVKLNKLVSLDSVLLQFVLISSLVVVCSRAAENGTNEWEAPFRVQKLFPYYLSGFDEEGRPIIAVNWGAWDIRSFLEEDAANFDIFDKYIQQFVQRCHDSPAVYPQSKEVNQYTFVVNMEGYDLRQLSHLPSLRSTLGTCRHFFRVEQPEPRLHKVLSVNANFVFQTLFSLARPVLGQLASRFENYGTNSDVWKPIVFREAPRSQLPEWLGGFPNHTHIQVWG